MKKEIFKEIIEDFHIFNLPDLTERELNVPLNLDNKAISIIGARRVGKTFYLYQLIKKILLKGIEKNRILYINFEDERLYPLNVNDLTLLLDTYYEMFPDYKNKVVWLFFDEIQNIENWELFIRRILDKEKVRVFITGSSSKLLSKEIATSLRGRTISFILYPFTFREFLLYNKIFDWERLSSAKKVKIVNLFNIYLREGGFPELFGFDKRLQMKIIQEYFDLTIYRDLIDRYHVKNLQLIRLLIKYLINNMSYYFSVNKFFNYLKSIGYHLSRDTVYEYIDYLEDIFFISLIKKYDFSIKRQEVASKKVYLLDNAFRTYLGFNFSNNIGQYYENLFFNELRNRGEEVFYYKNNFECDFISINNRDELFAYQVSYDIREKSTYDRELNGLLKTMDKFKIKNGYIINSDIEDEFMSEGKVIKIVPMWKFIVSCK